MPITGMDNWISKALRATASAHAMHTLFAMMLSQ
jgi:hypothetical protein